TAAGGGAARGGGPAILLATAGPPARAPPPARRIADQLAAAFQEHRAVRELLEIGHEDRLFARFLQHEARRAPERERGERLAVGDLEPHQRGPVLLEERLHAAAGVEHDGGKRTQLALRREGERAFDDADRLVEADRAQRVIAAARAFGLSHSNSPRPKTAHIVVPPALSYVLYQSASEDTGWRNSMAILLADRAWKLQALIVFLLAAVPPASAQQPMTVRVNAFPNAKALPLHAGIAKGIFEKRGFKVELTLTENSRNQREGLVTGKSDIVHSAVDNAVAMIEVAKQDVVIVSGGDSGMNEFFVQPGITSFADLRG